MSPGVAVIGGGYGGAGLAETKMAGHALRLAEVMARNITAQLRGERPTATYRPSPDPVILLPLGTRGGVGQLPSPDGPSVLPAATVAEYRGADPFTGRFTEQCGTAPLDETEATEAREAKE